MKPSGQHADASYRATGLDGKTAYAAGGLSAMGEEAAGQEPARPRKRIAGKLPMRPAAPKVKATIHLSVEASQRLDIHATMMGFDRSGLVEKLINDHLRRYVVSDRGGPESGTAGEGVA
jgi:hypothetical protein